MTPDPSLYLLQARTVLETGKRFVECFDSKGIVLAWILAPFVAVLGANMTAAATAHLVFALGVMALMVGVARRWCGWVRALVPALLWLIWCESPVIAAGQARPEDLLCLPILLAASLSGVPGTAARSLMGVFAVWCLFTKSTMIFAPVGAFGGWWLARHYHAGVDQASRSEIVRESAVWLAALVLGSGLVLAWTWLFDDGPSWFEQSVTWPLAYKPMLWTGDLPLRFLVYLGRVHLAVLLPLAGVALVLAWRQGHRLPAAALAGTIMFDLLRLAIEGVPWTYSAQALLAPVLIAICLGAAHRSPGWAFASWALPLALLLPMLIGTSRAQWQAVRLRAFQGAPSPVELLAEQIRPHYREGESMLPWGNGVELTLRLHAPAPYPILPIYFYFGGKKLQQRALRHMAADPPIWVVTEHPEYSRVAWTTAGHMDGPYWVCWIGSDPLPECRKPPCRDFGTRLPGKQLYPYLPRTRRYELVADVGFAQAWRRVEESAPEVSPGT